MQFPGWIYATLRALEALALVGLVAHQVRGRQRLSNGAMWAVVLGYTGLTIVAYLWWTTTVTGTLGRLLVGPSAPVPASAVALDVNFADLITLAGYELGAIDATRQAPLTLYWRAQAPIPADYTVFVQLLSADDQIVGQADSPPQQGRYPTSLWDPGELVPDRRMLHLPATLAAGDYSILVGLYLPATGERLPLASGAETGLLLPPLHIEP